MELLSNRDFLFGLVAFVAGVLCLIKAILDRKGCIKLPGKITGFVQENGGTYFPVIEFNYQGEVQKMRTANGSSKPKGSEGDSVEVLYNPKNTRYVHIASNKLDYVISIGLIVCGIGIMIICFFK